MKLPGMRSGDLFDRAAQDDLLQIRNDLMTVYREIAADDERLFPLRYARAVPRRPRRDRGSTTRARERGTAGEVAPAGPGAAPPRPGAARPQVPVLLIPDGPERASVLPYDVLRRTLAGRGLDVLMMEHRGVGLSRLDAQGKDLPPHGMALREVLADLLAVLDHARVPQVAVLGTGYGAYLAQALAALHPERVHSLVLDSPLTSADDERIAQRTMRGRYWEGTVAATATTASALRRLVADGVVDGHRAGPVVLAVHEHGGSAAVRDLVDLLTLGRGQLTWNSVRQVLDQGWLQSTPYVMEHDLTARIAYTELGQGRHADGGPLDPLIVAGERAQSAPPFLAEPLDLHELAPTITAPTLVISGSEDLIAPPSIARALADRIPGARLLEVRGAGHSMLDTRSQITQIAARWSACGVAHLLPEHAAELADLPATPTDQALSRGLQIALAAERYSPWRLRVESVRAKREQAQVDPRSRRARHLKLD